MPICTKTKICVSQLTLFSYIVLTFPNPRDILGDLLSKMFIAYGMLLAAFIFHLSCFKVVQSAFFRSIFSTGLHVDLVLKI